MVGPPPLLLTERRPVCRLMTLNDKSLCGPRRRLRRPTQGEAGIAALHPGESGRFRTGKARKPLVELTPVPYTANGLEAHRAINRWTDWA